MDETPKPQGLFDAAKSELFIFWGKLMGDLTVGGFVKKLGRLRPQAYRAFVGIAVM